MAFFDTRSNVCWQYGMNHEHDWHTDGWADDFMKAYESKLWAALEYFIR